MHVRSRSKRYEHLRHNEPEPRQVIATLHARLRKEVSRTGGSSRIQCHLHRQHEQHACYRSGISESLSRCHDYQTAPYPYSPLHLLSVWSVTPQPVFRQTLNHAQRTLTLFAAAGSVGHDTDHHVQRFPTVNHDIASPLPPHKPADTPRSWKNSTSSDCSTAAVITDSTGRHAELNARDCSSVAWPCVHVRPGQVERSARSPS